MAISRFVTTCTLILLITSLSHAQMDSVSLSQEYFNQGMQVFDFSHRKQAAELFVLATQVNPKNAPAQFMAGQAIMLTIQKEQSLTYFRKAYQLDPLVDEDIMYYLGQAYHYSEEFDSAIQFYDRYTRILARSLDLEKSNKINEVNRKIFECRNAIIFYENPVNVTIEHVSDQINSEYPDYAPSITADESLMVFTTRRPDGNLNVRLANDLEYYEEIFVSEKVNGQWQPAHNIGTALNDNYHNSSVTISPDGTEMIVYHDSYGGDLFISQKNGSGQWQEAVSMVGVNSEYLESSATITADDQHVYFTSNRPGGYGGTDIYHADLGKNSRWINVTNLGPTINTELDEDGVFISSNGQHLYFSSNGHAGMGDLDLYRSSLNQDTREWSEPLNLGYPINSVENDIYFVLTSDERYAYFSSVRHENTGEQDIYRVDMQNWEPVDLAHPQYKDVFAKVEEDDAPKRGIVTVVLNTLDEPSGEWIEPEVTFSKGNRAIEVANPSVGTFVVNLTHSSDSSYTYEFQVHSPDHIPYTSSLYFTGILGERQRISDTLRLKRMEINVGYIVNLYFGLDEIQPISFEGVRSMIEMLKATPGMKVEVGGHTDNLGDEVYNRQLSQQRADVVKDYLVAAGADPMQLTAVGYGEARPIASNDSLEGRRLNRRTEFTILSR